MALESAGILGLALTLLVFLSGLDMVFDGVCRYESSEGLPRNLGPRTRFAFDLLADFN